MGLTMSAKTRDFLVLLLAALIKFFLTSLIVYWLWNWMIPDLFGFKEITLLQAFLLYVLARLLMSPITRNNGKP